MPRPTGPLLVKSSGQKVVGESVDTLSVPVRRPSILHRFRSERVLFGAISIIVVLGVWELLGDYHVINKTFLSTPSAVASAGYQMFQTGEFWHDVRASGFEFVTGYGLSIAVAVPAGLVIGSSDFLTFLFEPWLAFLYALPRIALTPLILIWAGIGVRAIVIVVFLGSFFTIILSVLEGARQADARYKRVANVFGASRRRQFTSVTIPSSVPFVLTGLRLGVARAVIGVVIGELLAGLNGLGHFISVASESFLGDKVLAATALLVLFALITSAVIGHAESRFAVWRE